MTTIGERIKQYRLMKGYTQQKLADLVGYKDKASISIIEKNGEDLTQSKIVAFAKALGVTPRDLLGETPTEFDFRLTKEQAMLIYGYNAASEELKDAIFRILNMIRPNGEHSDDKSSLL